MSEQQKLWGLLALILGIIGVCVVVSMIDDANKKPQDNSQGAKVTVISTLTPPQNTEFFSPVFSPDGQKMAFICEWGPATLCITWLNSWKTATILDVVALNVEPSWSPDGTKIVFVCDKGLCIVGVDDHSATQVRMLDLGDVMPAQPNWSPDGTQIAYVCQAGYARACLIKADGSGTFRPSYDTKLTLYRSAPR